MYKTAFRLTLAGLLAFSAGAHAQQAETAAPESQAEAEAAAPDIETEAAPAETPSDDPVAGLDTGRAVEDENAPYVRETHGDWSLRCFPTEGQDDLCQMYQLLTEEAGNPVAEFSLYRLEDAGAVVAGATLAVPLGTLLTEEIKLSVDQGNPKSYAYSYCTMAGCFARIGLTQPEIDAMKRGATATLEIVPAQAPTQTVRIDVSLKGFTAAFEASSALQN